ncbi:hypothetical protein HPB47_012217 [Ixodes persulcatus]|uniref:Uncharacterized protein n=1 Tax=Ixodes persulcatus TaxID=34615 RepID=A0AC60NU35_IXOPE|nr:hypothetical protein HPB47_012217 [Ixodes persulcatus]
MATRHFAPSNVCHSLPAKPTKQTSFDGRERRKQTTSSLRTDHVTCSDRRRVAEQWNNPLRSWNFWNASSDVIEKATNGGFEFGLTALPTRLGSSSARHASTVLSKYFPFIDSPDDESQPTLDVAGFFNQQFESPDTLHQLVKSCLQDPTFPHFVQQVEAVLNQTLDEPS